MGGSIQKWLKSDFGGHGKCENKSVIIVSYHFRDVSFLLVLHSGILGKKLWRI